MDKMVLIPEHTVSIDDTGFYAENPDISEPLQRYNYDTIEIMNGPPHTYKTNTKLRTLTFQATIINKKDPLKGTCEYDLFIQETLKMLGDCVGIHRFTSIYIGSFQALIEAKIAGFKPESVIISFTVTEVF